MKNKTINGLVSKNLVQQLSMWEVFSANLPLIIGFAVMILWFILYYNGLLWTNCGELAGSDTYMRLNRVVQLHETGHWYDNLSVRSNAPFGETLHWTRPLDAFLLAGACLLSPFLGFNASLFWWGVMISPFLQVLTLLALIWAVKPILDHKGLLCAAFIFLCQIYLIVIFQAGRPDHHSLLLFVFVICLGFTLRLLLQPLRPTLCYAAGAVSALSVWISVESLLPLATNLATLSLMWVLSRSDFSRKILQFCLALVGATLLSLLLERPWFELLRVEYDSLSIIHLFLFALLNLIWLFLWLFDRHPHLCCRLGSRMAFGIGGCVLWLLMIWLTFPQFFGGPFVNVDPRIIHIWLSKVGEVTPIISLKEGLTPQVILKLFPASLGLAFALYLTISERHGSYRPWLYLLLNLLAFTIAAQNQERWVTYADILFSMVAAECLVRSMKRLDLHLSRNFQRLAHLLIVFLFCLSIFHLDSITRPFFPRIHQSKLSMNVSMMRLCEYLNAVTPDGPPRRILTHIFSGPEILYRTRHEVIGTPYHRNASGILYTYNVMTAPTPEVAKELLQERHIDLIILCLNSNESDIYAKDTQDLTFYQRLRRGETPDWLKNSALSPDLSSLFKVYEVLPECAASEAAGPCSKKYLLTTLRCN